MAEPIITLGTDVELDENNSGEPVIRHTPSGAEFKYDSTNNEWTLGDINISTTLTDASGTAHTGELADLADVSSIQTSSDVDHDSTTNRNHNGDSITPSSVSVSANVDVNDSSTDPSTNGEIRQNSGDVKVYSGGSVRNMSNIGSGGGGADRAVVGAIATEVSLPK